MKQLSTKIFVVLTLASGFLHVGAQTCQTRDEIPEQSRTAIESAAKQVFDQSSRADVEAVKAASAPSLQSGFNGVAAALNDNKEAFAGASPQLRTYFVLDTGSTASGDGTFFCGVYGSKGTSAGGAQFSIPGLPAGKYAVVIQDFIGNKGPYAMTTIFQDISGWKLAGYYVRPESIAGHDGLWYLQQARDYKKKGQSHNAWFYYQTSWELLAPVNFMNTTLLGNIQEESNGILPRDVPVEGKPVAFAVGGKNYTITDMTIFRTDKNFDLSVKYSVPSTSDFNATQADARGLATAMAEKYPELKDGFNNIWVHAVDTNGGDVVGLVKLK